MTVFLFLEPIRALRQTASTSNCTRALTRRSGGHWMISMVDVSKRLCTPIITVGMNIKLGKLVLPSGYR